jgi:hypothetical protein
MLDYYGGSIGNALKDIYPTVQWHEPNFYRMSFLPPAVLFILCLNTYTGNYWHNPLNRRSFFDSYARAMGFDPLIASNWYSVTTAAVLRHPVSITYFVYFYVFYNFREDML